MAQPLGRRRAKALGMPQDDDEPRLPGDLPPLPSRFYRGRPRHPACVRCGQRFETAGELNEHARRAHPPDLSGREGEEGREPAPPA